VLGLDPLGLSLNRPISDGRLRSNGWGGHRRGGAARSRGEGSPETRRLATTGLQRLGGLPGRDQDGLADSAMAFTLAQGHQRAQTTTRRANGGAR
jgi:hypothetical protein